MIPYFAQLGNRIEAAYTGDASTLPAIALAELQRTPPHEHTSLAEVMTWVATVDAADFVPQRDPGATFGEPPVTVFRSEGFCIDVNLWGTSTTQIHEHAFSGAFAVLEGSSLQCRYAFHEHRKISGVLALGELTFLGADHLLPGSCSPIHPGSLIHSLFHLGVPSATVVVRTYGEVEWLPQRSFDPPGVALDSHYVSTALAQRRRQLVHFLASAAVEGGQRVLGEIIARSPPIDVYLLLTDVLPPYWRAQGLSSEQLHETVSGAFGGLIWTDEGLGSALKTAGCRRVNHRMHASVRQGLTELTDRQMAAALLCTPDRRAVEEVLTLFRPDTAPEAWVRDFAARMGEPMNDPGAPVDVPESSLLAAWFR